MIKLIIICIITIITKEFDFTEFRESSLISIGPARRGRWAVSPKMSNNTTRWKSANRGVIERARNDIESAGQNCYYTRLIEYFRISDNSAVGAAPRTARRALRRAR